MYANFLIQVSVQDLLEESNIVLGNRSAASDIDVFYFPDVDATTEADLWDDDCIKETLGDTDCFEEGPFSAPNVSIHVHRITHTYTSGPVHLHTSKCIDVIFYNRPPRSHCNYPPLTWRKMKKRMMTRMRTMRLGKRMKTRMMIVRARRWRRRRTRMVTMWRMMTKGMIQKPPNVLCNRWRGGRERIPETAESQGNSSPSAYPMVGIRLWLLSTGNGLVGPCLQLRGSCVHCCSCGGIHPLLPTTSQRHHIQIRTTTGNSCFGPQGWCGRSIFIAHTVEWRSPWDLRGSTTMCTWWWTWRSTTCTMWLLSTWTVEPAQGPSSHGITGYLISLPMESVQLYTMTGNMKKGRVTLPILRCARGSTSLESFHLHLARFVPGSSAGAVNFQAYILDGICRWNSARAVAAVQSPTVETFRTSTRSCRAEWASWASQSSEKWYSSATSHHHLTLVSSLGCSTYTTRPGGASPLLETSWMSRLMRGSLMSTIWTHQKLPLLSPTRMRILLLWHHQWILRVRRRR